jgi:hypothetical protein
MQLEQTGDMYRRSDFPEEYVNKLGVNTGTLYGGPSIDDSNAVLLSGESWIKDPTLLNAKGDIVKAPSYVRNLRNRNQLWTYPGRERGKVSTADSNLVYSGLGAKPFGPQPGARALTDDQELYNMFQDSIARVGARYGYTIPADFQAAIWSPTRELFEGDVIDVNFIERPLNLTQEAADALRIENPDPRGYRDRMVEAAAVAAERDMAAAQSKTNPVERATAISKAQKKRAQQLAKFEKINRSNPQLMALLKILGVGGVGAGYSVFRPLAEQRVNESPQSAYSGGYNE